MYFKIEYSHPCLEIFPFWIEELEMLEKLQAIPIKRASGFQKQTLTEHIYLGNNPLKFKV